MFQKLRSYINNQEYEMQVSNEFVHINNYDEINTLTDTVINIKYQNNNYVTIKGKDLNIKKLIDKELLLQGKIEEIKFYVS